MRRMNKYWLETITLPDFKVGRRAGIFVCVNWNSTFFSEMQNPKNLFCALYEAHSTGHPPQKTNIYLNWNPNSF